MEKEQVTKVIGPTLRQRMQPNSKWKLTSPLTVDKAISYPKSNLRGTPYQHWEYVPDYDIPAGEEITVTGKFITRRQYSAYSDETKLYLPIKWGSKELIVRFNAITNPEQVGEAEVVPVFCLRDSDTGEVYSKYEWADSNNEIRKPIMTDQWSQFKFWNRLSDVRTALLVFTGYYSELVGTRDLPEWMVGDGNKMFDIPRTWEIVKFDKLKKKPIECIECIQSLDRAWRLRDLTAEFGSEVRGTYSYLEKKGKLDDFKAILVFGIPESQLKLRKWHDDSMTVDERKEITDCLNAFNKKDIYRWAVAVGSESKCAIAVKDLDTALMIKLQYSGTLECQLLDLDTLTEVIQTN